MRLQQTMWLACGLWLLTGAVQAADYCCTCRGQTTGKTLSASDDLSAGFECTVLCKRPTRAKAGQCEAPPAPAAAPAPAAPPAPPSAPAVANSVLLYASDDCSGEARSLGASSAKLSDQGISGIRSFSVASGLPAAAFEQPGYGGARSEPVAAGLCVSPGWEVAGIRLLGQ
ncbi:MAG TPA: hypothetical protein VFU53_12765 [Burkholderiales bacterium]|nr:hypothetical protein [Burkholderiales bacterium]